jgi:hypothetical protein
MNVMRFARLLIAVIVVSNANVASADNFAGDYNPLPAGTSILGLRYSYASGGDFYARGEKLDDDFHYQDQQVMLTLNYYAGQRVRWGLLAMLPMGHTEASSDRLHLDSSDTGLGDAQIIAAIWPLIGQNYHLGLTGWLFFPVGSYDSSRVVNQGLNAWSAKAEGNFTWRPRPGWALELTSAVRFFDDNDDFGPAHATLERAPRFTVETHVVKNLPKNVRVSLDYFYHCGSETTVNGYERDDGWDDHAAQLSVLWRFAPKQMLTFWYRNDFKVRSGPEFQTAGVRFMQVL